MNTEPKAVGDVTEFSAEDMRWMQRALELACRAEAEGEVPVGAVVVKDGEVVGEGWNQPIGRSDPSAHAEFSAIRQAAARLKNYRLPGTTLYVTLEPCTMCSGCMIHARIERVVYAAPDPRTGAAGSMFSVLLDERHNHRVDVQGGLMAEESATLLRDFFRARRKKTVALPSEDDPGSHGC
ncbi:MAG: tRNA adenosine(34) deaminase TadA [bacterium]